MTTFFCHALAATVSPLRGIFPPADAGVGLRGALSAAALARVHNYSRLELLMIRNFSEELEFLKNASARKFQKLSQYQRVDSSNLVCDVTMILPETSKTGANTPRPDLARMSKGREAEM